MPRTSEPGPQLTALSGLWPTRSWVHSSGWKERDLIVGRKSDAGKLAIAGRLRRETTLTIGKIAQRLHLGSSKSANARIHEWMRAQAKESVNENLNQPGEKTMLWSDSFTFRLHELFQIGLPFDGELHSRRR